MPLFQDATRSGDIIGQIYSNDDIRQIRNADAYIMSSTVSGLFTISSDSVAFCSVLWTVDIDI